MFFLGLRIPALYRAGKFKYFLNHILKVLGIDEEIEDAIPTEYITLNKKENSKILTGLLDFAVITKSGKIIIFEFKKNMLRKKDLKQVYDYYRQVYCKEKSDVIAIIIVISKHGKIEEYTELDVTYHPRIIKTKKINKQKDLKIIRDKFNDDITLTSEECSLLIALPLFDLNESEAEIIEEICQYIKFKKHCLPDYELDGIIMGMYLNILEYIDFENQDELKEMIEVETRTKGVIASFKEQERKKALNQGINQGINQGKKAIISELLKKHSITAISSLINLSESEIYDILKGD